MVHITTPGRVEKALKQYIKEEQASTSTLNSSKCWLAAHTINNTGHGILFMTIKLHRQLIKLLTEVLEIPPSEP